MAYVTWLLLPIVLLGGVPFPPSGYHTLTALRQSSDTCESSIARPCPKNKFASTDHPHSPSLSWSSAAVASAMPTNLRNPSSLLGTFKERLNKAHAKAKPSPAFLLSNKQVQTKHEVRSTKEGYGTSLSSASARLPREPTPATLEENEAPTTEASIARRMSSTNSPEESFPQTTAVRRGIHFQRGLLTTNRGAEATARMFLREEAVKAQVHTTTNQIVPDGNEHKAMTASDDTDVKRVASVLMLRPIGGRDANVFWAVVDFATRPYKRLSKFTAAEKASASAPDVGVSTVRGSILTESSETFTGRNMQPSAMDTEVLSTQATAAAGNFTTAQTSSHVQVPFGFYVTSVTTKRKISEAMDVFSGATVRSTNNSIELNDTPETDEMLNIVSRVVIASPGNGSVELSSGDTASEENNIIKSAEASTTTPYANALADTTLNESTERQTFELTTRPYGTRATRKLARKVKGCFFVSCNGYEASSSTKTLHEIRKFTKALMETSNRTSRVLSNFDKSTAKTTTAALPAMPNTRRFETESMKEINLGGTATDDIDTEIKDPSAVTFGEAASYVNYGQIKDGDVANGQDVRLLTRHPRAAGSFSTIMTSTTNYSPPQTALGTNKVSRHTKVQSEKSTANENGHLLTPVLLVKSSEIQTTNVQPIAGSPITMLTVETEHLTSTNWPQTTETTQRSTLLGNAAPTGTRFTYESRTPLITEQRAEVSTVTVSPGVGTGSVKVHKELPTEPSQLMTSGGDEVTELFKTNSESEVSTLQTTQTAWSSSSPEKHNSDTTQVTSPKDLQESGTSTDHGLTLQETTSVMSVPTELINMQSASLSMTSADVPSTEREISGVISTHTQNPYPMMTTTKNTLLTVELTPPTQHAAVDRTTVHTTLYLTSQQTAAATPGDRDAVTVDVGRSSSPSQSSTSQAGGPLNSGIDPKETGRRQPEVTRVPEPPEAYPSVNGVRVRLGLDADYGACVRGREWQFREHIRRQLSVLLRVPLPGVRNVRVLPGSIIVEAEMVPVKTPSLDVDKSALLAARTDLQDRINRGTAVVTDLDGNRLPIFTSTVNSLQPPRGTSYSPALLGALTAMFFGATSVIVASAYLVKRHVGEGHVSPSPEAQADIEQQPVDERPFLRLVSPGLLISTRLDDPATASILRDARMLPRRSLVPDPPVYRPARDVSDAPPVTSLPVPSVAAVDPPESVATWQSHPFDSSVTPSDAFSLATWSSTPFQPMSSVDFHSVDSEATSQWTVTPSERKTTSPESQVSKVTNSAAISEKASANGHIR